MKKDNLEVSDVKEVMISKEELDNMENQILSDDVPGTKQDDGDDKNSLKIIKNNTKNIQINDHKNRSSQTSANTYKYSVAKEESNRIGIIVHLAQMQNQGITTSMAFKQYSFLNSDPLYRAALAYFCLVFKNASLFQNLQEQRQPNDGEKEFDPRIVELEEKLVCKSNYAYLNLVPALQARYEFTRDIWEIAKITKNQSLKKHIYKDKYLYLTRYELEELLDNQDNENIGLIIDNKVNVKVEDNLMYTLLSVKKTPIDEYNHTQTKLLDFIGIMIETSHKKDHFTNEMLIQFIDKHNEYLEYEDTIKLFIIQKKFSQTIKMFYQYKPEFSIDFLTFGLENDAIDICFFLFMQFEEKETFDYSKIKNSHLFSYQKSNYNIKSKMYISQKLLPSFTFNHAKQFLNTVQQKMKDVSIEKNFFTSAPNPILIMCLLYDFVSDVKKSFFSLNNQCMLILEQTKNYIMEYINQTDDLLYLSELVQEKDLRNRDSLELLHNLELYEIMQMPKMEAVILRVYRSDYDSSGGFWELSTMYQILTAESRTKLDPEQDNRFYKARNMNEMPQNNVQYQIYKNSFLSRLRYSSIIFTIYVLMCIIYYTETIDSQRLLSESFVEMGTIFDVTDEAGEIALFTMIQLTYYGTQEEKEAFADAFFGSDDSTGDSGAVDSGGTANSTSNSSASNSSANSTANASSSNSSQTNTTDSTAVPDQSNETASNNTFGFDFEFMIDTAYTYYLSLKTLTLLSVIHCLIFLQHIIEKIAITKLNRKQKHGVSFYVDLTLFVTSLVVIIYFQMKLKISDEGSMTLTELKIANFSNLMINFTFNILYAFAIQISCLIIRLAIKQFFNQQLGPIIKIYGKMVIDFMNFMIIFCILILMFSMAGTILFIFYAEEYRSLPESLLTVFSASLNQYSFDTFNNLPDNQYKIQGVVFTFIIVIILNVMILNLLISILSNTYSNLVEKSKGLFLSMIVDVRDEFLYDDMYGALLIAEPPFNALLIPLLPFFLFMRKPRVVNELFVLIQYTFILLVVTFCFIAMSLIMMPFAYIKGSIVKCQKVFNAGSFKAFCLRLAEALLFIILGCLLLSLALITDLIYFWRFNFKKDLKKVVIYRDQTVLSYRTFMKMLKLCEQFAKKGIRVVYSKEFLKKFRHDFQIYSKIQYLIFGQNVRNIQESEHPVRSSTIFGEYHSPEEEEQYRSIQGLKEFNQIKSIIFNCSYEYKNENVVQVEILYKALDQMRREYKIQQITKAVDAQTLQAQKSQSRELKKATTVGDKQVIMRQLSDYFKQQLAVCTRLNSLKLNIMYNVVREVNGGQLNVLNPERYQIDGFNQKMRMRKILAKKKNVYSTTQTFSQVELEQLQLQEQQMYKNPQEKMLQYLKDTFKDISDRIDQLSQKEKKDHDLEEEKKDSVKRQITHHNEAQKQKSFPVKKTTK